MAQNQLRQLRTKLQEQQKEFQNYREECKNLENFLQAETNKKQTEIRKLKEQAITKERLFKSLKTQNSSLLAEITGMRNQLGKASMGLQKNLQIQKKLEALTQGHQDLQIKCKQLNEQIQRLKTQKKISLEQLQKSRLKIEELQQQAKDKDNKIIGLATKLTQNEAMINSLNDKIEQLQSKKVKLEDLPTSHKQIKDQRFMTAKKTKKREESDLYEQKLKRYEEKILRYQRQIRQLKAKLAEQAIASPSKNRQEEEQSQRASKLYIACHVVTKQYYLSPIVEVSDEAKSIKLFKSSRNGCFDKSLGASKHKFDAVSHDSSLIIKQITERIIKSQEYCNHSILIYGVKKSNKKQIMGSILTKLFNFLKNKVQSQTSEDLEAIYMKRTPDQQSSFVKEIAFNSDDILDILQKVTNIANSQLKKTEKSPSRKIQKPRVCYFSLRAGDFTLQIGTSSFTNIPYRQKQVLSTFYSNVLYSKLSDILQPAHSQKFIIITLNPIVDLYQDCKNTLSVTQYKATLSSSKDLELNLEGSNKEILNDLVRKKMEGYEKQIEQNLLKIKKVEDECFYFKSKFDELENRLKNLLSTHHGQNSYLKKSPILLSYQKMLKFIHAVQAKSPIHIDNICSTMRINALDFDFNDSEDQNEAL